MTGKGRRGAGGELRRQGQARQGASGEDQLKDTLPKERRQQKKKKKCRVNSGKSDDKGIKRG